MSIQKNILTNLTKHKYFIITVTFFTFELLATAEIYNMIVIVKHSSLKVSLYKTITKSIASKLTLLSRNNYPLIKIFIIILHN